MERVDRIYQHPIFCANLKKNRAAEADRCFCRHDMEHFLDVARIAMIINLEEKYKLPGDWIYAVGLLHDIGKHRQYEEKIPHEIASAEIARIILPDCGYAPDETEMIVDAIVQHRNSDVISEKSLRGVLYRADKASRACFACKAEQDCNWSDQKKNLKIRY